MTKNDPKEFFLFSWQVAQCGYQWIEATPFRYFRSVQATKGLFLSTGRSAYEKLPADRYYPLKEHSGLFLKFAGLDPERPESLLKFANQYGPLGEWVGIRLPSSKEDYDGEPYEKWSDEISAMHDAIELWERLKSRDQKWLSEVIQWVIYKTERAIVPLASPYIRPELLKRFPPNRVELPAWSYLQSVINEHLSGRVSPSVFWQIRKERSGNPLELYFSPENLIGALWLQFAQSVTGGREYRQCQHCGKPFVLAPDTARTNRLNCSDSCKTSASRRRIKERQTKPLTPLS